METLEFSLRDWGARTATIGDLRQHLHTLLFSGLGVPSAAQILVFEACHAKAGLSSVPPSVVLRDDMDVQDMLHAGATGDVQLMAWARPNNSAGNAALWDRLNALSQKARTNQPSPSGDMPQPQLVPYTQVSPSELVLHVTEPTALMFRSVYFDLLDEKGMRERSAGLAIRQVLRDVRELCVVSGLKNEDDAAAMRDLFLHFVNAYTIHVPHQCDVDAIMMGKPPVHADAQGGAQGGALALALPAAPARAGRIRTSATLILCCQRSGRELKGDCQ